MYRTIHRAMAQPFQNSKGEPIASEEIRRQLIVLCQSERTRAVGMPPNYRSKWQPRAVRHPESGEPFSPVEAWHFAQHNMEQGCEIEAITLSLPPGKTGFVIHAAGYAGEMIYIKLQIVGSRVIGRSFHVSEKPARER
jgi:hypothetical protein